MTLRPFQPSARAKSIAGPLLTSMAGALMLLASAARAADAASLTVTFEGLKTHTGSVMLSLVGEAAYDGKAAPAAQTVISATGDTVIATFDGLAPGPYAIKAFHDVDGDGKMGANPFGMPTEPYAFSNNAAGAMGPPKWSAAAFEVKAGANTHAIKID
jgi:uncharacterized protein (DUF2141 family)